jgi:hypothetical protein
LCASARPSAAGGARPAALRSAAVAEAVRTAAEAEAEAEEAEVVANTAALMLTSPQAGRQGARARLPRAGPPAPPPPGPPALPCCLLRASPAHASPSVLSSFLAVQARSSQTRRPPRARRAAAARRGWGRHRRPNRPTEPTRH